MSERERDHHDHDDDDYHNNDDGLLSFCNVTAKQASIYMAISKDIDICLLNFVFNIITHWKH